MSRLLAGALGVCLAMASSSGQAKLSFVIDGSLPVTQRRALSVLVTEVEKVLPAKMTEALDAISLGVDGMGARTDEGLPLTLPHCNLDQDAKLEDSHTYAYYDARSRSIRFNRRLLYDIEHPSDPDRLYECGHRSMYRLAMAALIHELGHAYDSLPHEDSTLQKLARACRYRIGRHCRRLRRDLKRKMGLSGRESFHKLIHWGKRSGKNKNLASSPDPYEYQSPSEAFAVNLEYFLLDPEYALRRPSYALYFAKQLEHSLEALSSPEKMNTSLPGVKVRGERLSLDPERVYAVHYLVASSGKGVGSRFGHAMLRFVMCPPKHRGDDGEWVEETSFGPECMSHEEFDLVLSYAAKIKTLESIHYWRLRSYEDLLSLGPPRG